MSEKTPLLPRSGAIKDAPPRRGLSIIHALRVLGAVAGLGLGFYSVSGKNHTLVLILAGARFTNTTSRRSRGIGNIQVMLDTSLRSRSV
jgi:hypothetical protein